jgi:hypothetical protein
MSLYKFYTATVGDAAASIDIVKSGKIEAIQWATVGDLDADGEAFNAELSFSSSSGFTTHDTKSSISAIRQLAAGTPAAYDAVNLFMAPLAIGVTEGERLYLHTSGAAIICTVYVWVNDGLDLAGRQRRVRQ